MTPTLLKQGSSGTEVAKLQTALKTAGYDPGLIDSQFGPKTASALSAYQTSKGLKADSVFGPITSASLYGNVSQGTPPTISSGGLGAEALVGKIGGAVGSSDVATTPVVATSAEARATEIQKIKDELSAGLNQPTPYKSVEEFNKLRTEQGVVKDEEELSAIQNEARLLKEEVRQFSATAGEGTSEGGRLGVMSEVERNANFKLEGLALRETAVLARVNTKNSYINTVVGLGKDDYQTASTNYTNEYNKNVKAIELYNSELDDQAKDALTGFSTLTNLLKESNITDISPEISTQLDSYALKLGLPTGLLQEAFQGIGVDAKLDNVKIVGDNVYMWTTDKAGTPHLQLIQSLPSDGGGAKTEAERRQQELQAYSSAFVPGAKLSDGTAIIDGSGFVTPVAWKQAIADYKGDRADFIKKYGYLIYQDKDGNIDKSYGLTPQEQKLITG